MKLILKLFLILSLLLWCQHIHAKHILGGTLGYTYKGKNGNKEVYTVTLELYAECKFLFSGAPPPVMIAPAQIYVFNKNGTYTYQSLRFYSVSDVPLLCPDEATSSTCIDPFSILPGLYLHTYEADIELEGVDENWVFAFLGSGPTGLLAHYSLFGLNAETEDWTYGYPIGYVLYLEARLNNTKGPNSSPKFLSPPVSYSSAGTLTYYSPGAIDPDLDELGFSLVPSWKVNALVASRYDSLKYYPGFSSNRPLPCAPDDFNFNPSNGQMIFTPRGDTNSFVNFEVSEYRDGIEVGSSMRQTTFVFMEGQGNNIANTPVSNIKNADYTTDANNNIFFTGCEGLTDTISFDVNATDPDGDNVTVSYAELPAGASIDITNNDSPDPVVRFKWGLTEAKPATYFFYIIYRDDGCPVATFKTVVYTITIIPHGTSFVLGTRGSCALVPDGKAWAVPIGVNTNYSYKWIDTTTGNIISNTSSTTGDTLKNVPPGVYKVYVRNEEGCGKNFIFTVDTTPLPTLNRPDDSLVCEGMPILIGNQREMETSYRWNTGDTTPSLIVHNSGNYILAAENHCGITTDTVQYSFVKCNFCLFVPNAFSPNGDGRNDVLKITPTCLFETFKLLVFNRYGQLVYNSYSLNDSWDGTFNGSPADAGTYFYSVEAKYEDKSRGTLSQKGDVTLLR